MKKQLNAFISFGFIGLLIFGSYLISDFYEAFYGSKSIYWTPKKMMLSLDQTRDHFELWINDIMLQKRLDEGSLYALDEKGDQYRVVSKDIGIRLNNWQAHQSWLLKYAVISAFFSGISLALFLVGIIQIFQQQQTKNRTTGVPFQQW